MDKGEIVVCGQEYMHKYKEKDRKFELVKKLGI